MGRKKKDKTTPKPTSNSPPALDDRQRLDLTVAHKRKYVAALDAKRKAEADFKNICKAARADLGDYAIDNIKDLIQLSTEEGEKAFRAHIDEKVRVARWEKLMSGEQLDWLDISAMPAEDRAFHEGEKACREDQPCRPPYDQSVPQYAAWMDGYYQTQKRINTDRAAGIKPLSDTPSVGPEVSAMGSAPDTAKTIN
jgi:hypothetical protein